MSHLLHPISQMKTGYTKWPGTKVKHQLFHEKSQLINKAIQLRRNPYNFKTGNKDTYTRAWLEYRKEWYSKWRICKPKEEIIGLC